MAIGRLPSGNFRAWLMIDGHRHTATLPTEAGARDREIQTCGAVIRRRVAGSVTFAAYATGWLPGFGDDAPDRTRFEAALEHRLLPVLGERTLLELLEADRRELRRQVMDAGGDVGTTRGCLCLILEDAAEDLRARQWVRMSSRVGRSAGPGCGRLRGRPVGRC